MSCRRSSPAAHIRIELGRCATKPRRRRQPERRVEPRAIRLNADRAGAVVHRGAEDVALAPAGHEPVRGRAEDEPRDQLGVAPPQELGDEATHGVADHDHRAAPQLVDEHRQVVGAVLEPEPAPRPDAPPVAAQVRGHDDSEPLAERFERRRPVQPGAGQPAVDESTVDDDAGSPASRTKVEPRPGRSTLRPTGTVRPEPRIAGTAVDRLTACSSSAPAGAAGVTRVRRLRRPASPTSSARGTPRGRQRPSRGPCRTA